MKFEYLTKAQFEALTDYQKEKYADEKRSHEMKETAEAAKVAAETAAGEKVKEVEDKLTIVIEAQKTEIASLVVKIDETDKKREAVEAKMERIQAKQTETEMSGLKAEIAEMFANKESEGSKQLASFKSKKSFNVELEGKGLLAEKAPGVIGVPAGTTAQQWLQPIGIPHETVQARDIIPVYPTEFPSINYVQFTKKDGSIASVAAGATKPQFDYTPTGKLAPVIKIAGWVSVQEEFLDDVVGSGAFLAQELPWAYKDEETRQVFKGNGTTELNGLYANVATALNFAGFEAAGTNSNGWDKMVVALTNSRRSLRPGDAIWISPEAYGELLMNKSTGDVQEYDYPIQATTAGQLAIGGIPIYFHTVFGATEGMSGNFSRGVALWQRKGITLRTSTEADQNFFKNLVTFLIEARMAMTPFFPESFKKIDFTRTT
jgi:HK97 family phage major capsid protein